MIIQNIKKMSQLLILSTSMLFVSNMYAMQKDFDQHGADGYIATYRYDEVKKTSSIIIRDYKTGKEKGKIANIKGRVNLATFSDKNPEKILVASSNHNMNRLHIVNWTSGHMVYEKTFEKPSDHTIAGIAFHPKDEDIIAYTDSFKAKAIVLNYKKEKVLFEEDYSKHNDKPGSIVFDKADSDYCIVGVNVKSEGIQNMEGIDWTKKEDYVLEFQSDFKCKHNIKISIANNPPYILAAGESSDTMRILNSPRKDQGRIEKTIKVDIAKLAEKLVPHFSDYVFSNLTFDPNNDNIFCVSSNSHSQDYSDLPAKVIGVNWKEKNIIKVLSFPYPEKVLAVHLLKSTIWQKMWKLAKTIWTKD